MMDNSWLFHFLVHFCLPRLTFWIGLCTASTIDGIKQIPPVKNMKSRLWFCLYYIRPNIQKVNQTSIIRRHPNTPVKISHICLTFFPTILERIISFNVFSNRTRSFIAELFEAGGGLANHIQLG